MKTDLIEIFQTIRAELQPYTTLGFNARINSETEYDLWKEPGFVDDKPTPEQMFASLSIKSSFVSFKFAPVGLEGGGKSFIHPSLEDSRVSKTEFHFTAIDEILVANLAESISAAYTAFKQKGWT